MTKKTEEAAAPEAEAQTQVAMADEVPMRKRTFFLIGTKPEITVVERFTCDDLREKLKVEHVDARLMGTEITVDTLAEKYPDAVRAAHYWSVMQSQAKADATLKGPYCGNSDVEPTDADLVNFYKSLGKEELKLASDHKQRKIDIEPEKFRPLSKSEAKRAKDVRTKRAAAFASGALSDDDAPAAAA